jgi:hypothetical protein
MFSQKVDGQIVDASTHLDALCVLYMVTSVGSIPIQCMEGKIRNDMHRKAYPRC